MREEELRLPKQVNELHSATNEEIEILDETEVVSMEPVKPKSIDEEVLTMSSEEDEIYKTMKIENLKRFQYQEAQRKANSNEKKLTLKYPEDDEPYKPSGFVNFLIILLILAMVVIALLIVVFLLVL